MHKTDPPKAEISAFYINIFGNDANSTTIGRGTAAVGPGAFTS